MLRTLQREGLWLAVVLVAAAGLRLAYLDERRAQPDFGHPEIDAGFHDDWARTIAFGEERSAEWRRSDRTDPLTGEPYLRPPGYPWFLSGVYRLSGGSETAAVLANHVCGLLTALLAFLVARSAAGGWAGLVAAAVVSFHWASIFFEGELHAPPLLGLFELAGVACLLRARKGQLWWACAAGLTLGAASLVRPNVLALLPVALLWLGWALGRRGVGWGRPVLAVTGGTLLALAPATLRNFRVSGEFVPITANLGINLYLGNHAGATGLISGDLGELGAFRSCYDYPAVVARLEEQEGRELGLSEVSGYFGRRARAWILDDLPGFFELTLLKARYLLGPAEIGHNKEVALEKEGSRSLRFLGFPFPLLVALALLGTLLAWRPREGDGGGRDRREVALLCGGLALAFAFSLLPFFAAARYRVPIVPLLAPLIGMVTLGGALGWRGCVAGLTLVLAWAAGPPGETASSKYHLQRAQGFFASGEFQRSRAEYDLAFALTPSDPAARYGAGVLEQKLGNDAAARRHYEIALEGQPLFPKANFNLGFLLVQAGDLEGALERWRLASEQDPLLAGTAYYRRGRLLLGMGRQVDALADLELAVERGRGEPAAVTYLTDLALLLSISSEGSLRDGERALTLADEARARADTPQVRYVRAAALAELGRYGEAVGEARAGLAAAPAADRARFEAALERYQASQPVRMGP